MKSLLQTFVITIGVISIIVGIGSIYYIIWQIGDSIISIILTSLITLGICIGILSLIEDL